jgi:hypothetical protein
VASGPAFADRPPQRGPFLEYWLALGAALERAGSYGPSAEDAYRGFAADRTAEDHAVVLRAERGKAVDVAG